MKEKTLYDSPFSCNKCGEENICTVKDSIDRNVVTEYETTCTACGFEDYWVTGFFESHVDGCNASKKYSF
jgi:predicted RNA-binding Zn-ribbon protein involved in translation (DUF1610 family)